MTDKHIYLLLEYYIQNGETNYIIDEKYKDFYLSYLNLNEDDNKLIEESYGARIHDIYTFEEGSINIRGHVTYNNKLYTFLAVFTTEFEIYTIYEVDEIIKSICKLSLPEEERVFLKSPQKRIKNR